MEKSPNSKVVHDINNSLTGIILAADFLIRDPKTLTNQQKKHLKDILSESRKIKDLVKKIR